MINIFIIYFDTVMYLIFAIRWAKYTNICSNTNAPTGATTFSIESLLTSPSIVYVLNYILSIPKEVHIVNKVLCSA